MPKEIDLLIGPDGKIESIYSDELKMMMQDAGGEVAQVCRASTVEWEKGFPEGGEGWVVRAAHNPKLALRAFPVEGMRMTDIKPSDDENHIVIKFSSREDALKNEKKFFWDLIPKKGNT